MAQQLLQHVESNSHTLTFPNPVHSGSLILIFGNINGGTIAASDNLGSSYSVIVNHTFTSTDQLVFLVAIAAASGSCTVTNSFGLGGLVGMAEFCGPGSTADITTVLSNGSATVSATTVTNDDLVIACLGGFHQNNYSVNAPFTAIFNAVNTYITWGYINNAAIATYSETFTFATTPVDSFMVAFKAAGGTPCPGGGTLLIHPGMQGGMKPQMCGGCNG